MNRPDTLDWICVGIAVALFILLVDWLTSRGKK